MKQYLPELDYYFKNYWNTYKQIEYFNVYLPEIESIGNISTNSVFALLFNNSFSESDYTYKFDEETYNYPNFSENIRERLSFTSNLIIGYIGDSTGNTTLVATTEEIIELLTHLYQYRINGTTDISSIVYANLSSNISKLIYIYLDAMINDDYDLVDDIIPISASTNMIDNLFELYVINEIYRKINNSTDLVDNTYINTRPGRSKIVITSGMITNKECSTNEEAYNLNYFYLFRNGNLLESSYYDVMDASASVTISWSNKDLEDEIEVGDILIADYLVEV